MTTATDTLIKNVGI